MLVVCNGLLRSGSTLQYNLARVLIETAVAGRGEGHVPDADFETATPRLQDWMADSQYHVVKLHGLHPLVAERAGSANLRIVYVHRDLREVAASLKMKWGICGTELVESLDEALRIGRAIGHLPGVLSQQFEELTRNTEGAASALNAFLELGLAPGMVARAAAACSKPMAQRTVEQLSRSPRTKLKFLLKRLGWHGDAYDPVTLLHHDHLSGSGESWPEVLDRWEVVTVSERREAWLKERGDDLGATYLPASPSNQESGPGS